MAVETYECESDYDPNLRLRGHLSVSGGRVQVGAFQVLFRGKVDVTEHISDLERSEYIDEMLAIRERELEEPREPNRDEREVFEITNLIPGDVG